MEARSVSLFVGVLVFFGCGGLPPEEDEESLPVGTAVNALEPGECPGPWSSGVPLCIEGYEVEQRDIGGTTCSRCRRERCRDPWQDVDDPLVCDPGQTLEVRGDGQCHRCR